ncbi:MAG: nucleotidyltransferase [Deltaproteobacteria bacterium]|jgi:D-glycero-alpha-D-manno-heptose 1-phosphate guanylyltransferase|nr:nucleotidyltransferase [Deltaproteobacteria bacterium]MBP1750362.1 nucleotidyltransferase [Deltaproteobacteria bacterium]
MENTKVIILAGGLGTRLRETLGTLPKPLAPVGSKPFLEYLLKFISDQGFRDVIISLGYGSDAIREYFGDGSSRGLRIAYTLEKELLGTAGAVKLSELVIGSDDFFVMNGDTYFEVDLKQMLRFHESRDAVATIALAYKEDTGRYGNIIIDKDNEIVSFSEKAGEGRAGYINGGIYIFRKEVLEYIPANKVCSLEEEIIPFLVGKGLYGFPVKGYFIDIGIPEDYEKAKREIPLRRLV